MAELINEVFENQGNINWLPEKPEDKTIYLMDSKKAKSILKWQQQWPLRKALSDMKDIYQNGE
jgi:nucleoside-diphosphate-sugar epimerase